MLLDGVRDREENLESLESAVFPESLAPRRYFPTRGFHPSFRLSQGVPSAVGN